MAIMAKDTRKDWTPAPEGLHQAVCVDVVDLGLVQTAWGEKHKVRLVWQLEDVNPETTKRFEVRADYGLSLNEKSRLRPTLEAWRGRKFTREELEGFDLEKLVGVNCQVQVVHNITEEGRTYANVQAVVPLGRGMVKLRADGYVRMKERLDKQAAEDEAASRQEDEVPF